MSSVIHPPGPGVGELGLVVGVATRERLGGVAELEELHVPESSASAGDLVLYHSEVFDGPELLELLTEHCLRHGLGDDEMES